MIQVQQLSTLKVLGVVLTRVEPHRTLFCLLQSASKHFDSLVQLGLLDVLSACGWRLAGDTNLGLAVLAPGLAGVAELPSLELFNVGFDPVVGWLRFNCLQVGLVT